IGVLTGGGDAPGLNAAIRAVVLRATALGHEVLGIADGWAGLLGEAEPRALGVRDANRILSEGGTILGTSRTDPRKDEASRLAGGADLIIVPEIQVTSEQIVRTMKRHRAIGDPDILVVVSEAAVIDGIEAETAVDHDAFGHVRLDQRAIGAVLARHIEQRTGIEARQVVLGHLQRGGSPTAVDRLRATRFGNAAADLVDAGRSGVLPVLRGGRIE